MQLLLYYLWNLWASSDMIVSPSKIKAPLDKNLSPAVIQKKWQVYTDTTDICIAPKDMVFQPF